MGPTVRDAHTAATQRLPARRIHWHVSTLSVGAQHAPHAQSQYTVLGCLSPGNETSKKVIPDVPLDQVKVTVIDGKCILTWGGKSDIGDHTLSNTYSGTTR